MAASPYEQLEQEFRRLHAFRGALSLLRWDAAVMMPRGSADVRGEQLAALETEHHALLTTPKVARLLERAEAASRSGARNGRNWPFTSSHALADASSVSMTRKSLSPAAPRSTGLALGLGSSACAPGSTDGLLLQATGRPASTTASAVVK